MSKTTQFLWKGGCLLSAGHHGQHLIYHHPHRRDHDAPRRPHRRAVRLDRGSVGRRGFHRVVVIQIGIHMSFLVSAVAIAWTDKLMTGTLIMSSKAQH